jgi:hypothetical protein
MRMDGSISDHDIMNAILDHPNLKNHVVCWNTPEAGMIDRKSVV